MDKAGFVDSEDVRSEVLFQFSFRILIFIFQMVHKSCLVLALTQLIFIISAKPKEGSYSLHGLQMTNKVEHGSNLVKRWAPNELHVGHLLRSLHQKMLEDKLKNQQDGRKSSRSAGDSEAETLEELLQFALAEDGGHDAEKRSNSNPMDVFLPVEEMFRLILKTLKEIQEQQLRDGYIGRPNPVRSVG